MFENYVLEGATICGNCGHVGALESLSRKSIYNARQKDQPGKLSLVRCLKCYEKASPKKRTSKK